MSRSSLLLFSALACACQKTQSDQPDRRTDTVAAVAPSGPNLYEKGGLSPLLSALREKVSQDPALLMLELRPDQATIQVEAPARLGQLVQYQWRGNALSDPVPLEIRGKGGLAQNLFALSAVDLSNLPTLIETAVTRVDAEHGKPSRVLVRRNLPQDDSVGIRVYVDSPRRSSHVDADARGKPLEAGKYP
jgi:hypothetical protein